jgi:hypothetical protein
LIALSETRNTARRTSTRRLPLVAASADERGFLLVYDRPGTRLSLADVYELAGMAVVG